jgi:tetratricopeptide (TPR) repeat protein
MCENHSLQDDQTSIGRNLQYIIKQSRMAAPPSQPSDTETTAPIANLKDPPSSQSMKPPPTPTYASSESSAYYVSAKALLNEGSFEDALATIEEGIESFKSDLLQLGMSEDDAALHESMAPFHYLYGTTLLYSIEESSDTQQIAQQQALPENPEEDGENAPEDDSEIAWENLDIARAIVERMIAGPDMSDKLKLDLAQIYLREGDLHRMNGKYENAIGDYESCLLYRQDNPAIGPFDRKIADVHYNLGLSRLLFVAEANTSGEEEAMDEATQRSMAQHRAQSFHNFYSCARTLSGQLAIICGLDASEFIAKCESNIPNFKSTGEEDFNVDHPKMAGVKLRKLRENVASLTPPQEDSLTFHEIQELLDEIQETIDEAETSEQGVREMADLKAEISAMVAGTVAEEEATEAAGVTTQINFGSSEAAATTAAAQPLMAVKKKKRPTDDPSDPAKKPRSE